MYKRQAELDRKGPSNKVTVASMIATGKFKAPAEKFSGYGDTPKTEGKGVTKSAGKKGGYGEKTGRRLLESAMDAVKAFHSKARQVNRTRVMRSIRSAVKGLVTTEGTQPRAVDRPQHHAPINVVSDTQRGNYKRPHWISHAVKPHKAQLLAAGAEADRWVAHILSLIHI